MAQALVQLGHSVSVVGLYPTPSLIEENRSGVRVVRIPHSRIPRLRFLENSLRLSNQLRLLSNQKPFDVLEGQENAFAFLPRAVARHRVLRMNGGHRFFHCTLGKKPRPVRSWIESRSFAKATHFCAVSHYVAEETRRLLELSNVPIEVLPNPVDTVRFRPMPEVSPVQGRIVFVGTLCEKKGIRQLALAMPEILAAVPHAHLIACGRDSKDLTTGGSYRDALQQAIPAEVRGRITFNDHVENGQLPRQLAAAEVLVYPSHMEAQGIVVIEGMAMGKPVVASKAGPGPELIEDGISGLLCDPHNSHSIAESVICVLKQRAFAEHLGAQARERVTKEFALEKIVLKNEQFYRRCLEGGRYA
jgi:glycosyltransferase involved in cell wall biosynthesis